MTPKPIDVARGMFPGLLSLAMVAAGALADSEPLQQEREAVERLRQLKFSAPVVQKTITREELQTFLSAQLAKQLPVPLDEYLRILDALELIENREGIRQALFQLYQSQVLAFYDPATDIYYALDTPPVDVELNPLMSRAVAIHELTHALQDQRFAAGDRLLAIKDNSDAQMAYQAVLEGEAMLVMAAALLEQFGQDLDAIVNSDAFLGSLSIMAGLNPGVPEGTPPYFVEGLKFPYLAGLSLVISAYRRGGWKEVDALHQDPPASTEQVLHPEKYFERASRDVPATIKPRQSDARLTEVMGEFGWRFLLGEKAADGWGGDSVQVKDGPSGKLTVLVESLWDSEEDADQFADAYRQFLKSRSLAPVISRNARRISVTYQSAKRLSSRAKRKRSEGSSDRSTP